jgi:hypothetical protein
MNQRLREALEIISGVDAADASMLARGHRAHARVLAMIESAEQMAGLREQALVANLLTLARMDVAESDAALRQALALLPPTTSGEGNCPASADDLKD